MKRPTGGPRTKNRSSRVFIAAAFACFMVATLLVWLAFFTDACRIREVVVTGNERLDEESVRRISGVDSYRNLITLPVGRLDEELERDPWVKEAMIQRKLLHTVKITVEEREPVAILDCRGAGFVVDGEGRVLEETSLERYPDIPRVHGGKTAKPRPGNRVGNGKVRESAYVLGRLPGSVRGTITLVNPFDGRGQVMVSREGFQIVYGSKSQADDKNEMLEAILTDIRNHNRNVKYVDVRVPDAPAVKLK